MANEAILIANARKSGKPITQMARILRMFAAAKRLSDRDLLFNVRKVPRHDA